jgi:DNA polymerase (family 10)
VEVLPPLYRMPEEQLRALDGIGDKLAKLIHGASIGEVPTELLTLRKSIPPSVFSMTKVAGIGPKVAVQLYKKYGVQDLESLLAGVDSGKVKGRVVKLIKISNTIRPIDLVEALILSKHILRHIERSLKHKVVLDVCGSIRRESHLVGDIDIIAGIDDQDIIKQISKEFCSLGIPIMEGEHKLSIYYPVIKGRQYIRVDLFCSKIQSLGAAFLYFTGNLGYNKALRKRAIDLGMTLNEYGLWKGSKNMASKTEKEVCSALGVRFLHPTKRIGADALVLDER